MKPLNPLRWSRMLPGRLAARVAWSARYALAKRRFRSIRPTAVLYPRYDAYRRPARRVLTAVALGLAVAAATVASYLVVASGLIGSPAG